MGPSSASGAPEEERRPVIIEYASSITGAYDMLSGLSEVARNRMIRGSIRHGRVFQRGDPVGRRGHAPGLPLPREGTSSPRHPCAERAGGRRPDPERSGPARAHRCGDGLVRQRGCARLPGSRPLARPALCRPGHNGLGGRGRRHPHDPGLNGYALPANASLGRPALRLEGVVRVGAGEPRPVPRRGQLRRLATHGARCPELGRPWPGR